MSQNTQRNSLHGFIETAAEGLLKEKDWHEQQLARIDAILNEMRALSEGKPFGEKSGRRAVRPVEEPTAEAA